MIQVTNVRGVKHPDDRAKICYVGRAWAGWPDTRWGNPYKGHGAVARFAEYAAKQPPEWLESLWEMCAHGEKPLGCWCVKCTAGDDTPVTCHGQILANMLYVRYGVKTELDNLFDPTAKEST